MSIMRKHTVTALAFFGASLTILSLNVGRANAQEAPLPIPFPEITATPPATEPEPHGTFRNTWYFLADERDYPGKKTINVRSLGGAVLAKVTPVFKRHLDMEGSGMLANGRVLNYRGKVRNQKRFDFTQHDFGRGAGNCSLRPMRTIAVDPTTIPLGSVVKIDETVGIRLPDGTIHDGIWRAEDTGSAIKGDRIDLFVGPGEKTGRILAEHGIGHKQALTVRILELPTPESCVNQDPQ